MSAARWIVSGLYALALQAFPAAHRAQYRAEMIESFDQSLADHRRDHGRARALRFGVAACLDVIGAGLGERRRRTRPLPAIGRHLANFGRDLRFGVRALGKTRTFTAVCVASLGIGLGAVLTISLVIGPLTATPAGIRAEGLVEVVVAPSGPLRAQVGNWAIETWSYPDYEDLRDADTGVATSGWAVDDAILGSSILAPRPVSAMYVSDDYFSLVGVAPHLGRGLDGGSRGDNSVQPAIVVSHRLWETQLAADPDVLGTALDLNRVEHVVVGVAPPDFRGHINRRGAEQADVWVALDEHPLLAEAADVRHDRGADWLRVVGRLAPDTTLAAANVAVAAVGAGLSDRYPESNEHRSASVVAYTSTGANQILEMGVITTMFYSMGGIVLIIVCLNVAGMLLVRSATRAKELGVRQALGASRGRLVGTMMSESVVLALGGGALSVVVVRGGIAALEWWTQGPLPSAMRLDASRVALCFAISLATTLLFGLVPSLRFSRPGMIVAIKDDAGGGSWRVGRVHRLAAAIQAGIALPFLALGGLMFAGAQSTVTADLGFDPDGLYAAAMDVAASGYTDSDAAFFLREVQGRIEQTPGVSAVALADGLPLDYSYRRTRVAVDGSELQVRAQVTRISEDYLATLGTTLLRGRSITPQDGANAEPVMVLSESLATRLFPDGDAVGQRVVSALQGDTPRQFTVVGITADVVTSQLQTTRPQIFVPLAQHPAPRVFMIARASAGFEAITAALDEAIIDLDPEFSRPVLFTGDSLVRGSIGDLLTQSTIAAVVAGVALALSALGIYGVVAFMVASRTREMGVRIALGASRRHVVNAVMIDTAKLIVPGLAVGLLLATFAVRQTGLLWYALGTSEPLAYTLATAAALGVALLASWPSASHAAAVEPVEAIRAD